MIWAKRTFWIILAIGLALFGGFLVGEGSLFGLLLLLIAFGISMRLLSRIRH